MTKENAKFALFTCDTEFNPPWYKGSWEDQDRSNFYYGIGIIEEILDEFGIRGTFYCQGVLVKEYPKIVCHLSLKHLIGSHGYNHENYGGKPVNVWTPEQPMFIKEKSRKFDLISKCIDIHKHVLGYEPKVFVAPFDSIDYDLLDVLEQLDFKVDSSFDNYNLGLQTRLFHPHSFDLYELPLSVIRSNVYGYKNILQGLTHDYSQFSKVIQNDIVYITCHPYEFIDIKIPHPDNVLIVGMRNILTLKQLIKDLLIEGYKFVDPLQLLDLLI